DHTARRFMQRPPDCLPPFSAAARPPTIGVALTCQSPASALRARDGSLPQSILAKTRRTKSVARTANDLRLNEHRARQSRGPSAAVSSRAQKSLALPPHTSVNLLRDGSAIRCRAVPQAASAALLASRPWLQPWSAMPTIKSLP